jgi:hypothetical protein
MTWPVRGQRYTIRANLSNLTQNGRCVFVLLREIHNRKDRWPNGMVAELGFWEERFELATDITLLENIRDFAGLQFKRHVQPVRRVRKKETVE